MDKFVKGENEMRKMPRRNAFEQDRRSISNERAHSAVSRVKSRFRVTDRNFIVLLTLLLSSRISQNWSAPDSIRCLLIVSRIIYLFQ